jgi:hypothetical protein
MGLDPFEIVAPGIECILVDECEVDARDMLASIFATASRNSKQSSAVISPIPMSPM